MVRALILAALGWLMLAASLPQAQRSQENRHPDQSIANSLENVAAAIERGNEREGYNPDCPQGADNRRSDLCAQWKAADAAYEAASWASWTWYLLLVGTVIGGATMGAAFAAAWFAKKAADHTEVGAGAAKDALTHARTVGAAELRAWVSPRVVPKEVSRIGDQLTIEYDVIFHNHGKTVASGYSHRTWLIFPREDEPYEDAVRAQWAKWKEPPKIGRAVLMPGEDDVFHGIRGSVMDLLPWGAVRQGRRHLSPIVVISVFYRTDFDDQWHRTDRAFSIGRRGELWLNEFIDDEEISLGPDELVAQPVSMSLAN